MPIYPDDCCVNPKQIMMMSSGCIMSALGSNISTKSHQIPSNPSKSHEIPEDFCLSSVFTLDVHLLYGRAMKSHRQSAASRSSSKVKRWTVPDPLQAPAAMALVDKIWLVGRLGIFMWIWDINGTLMWIWLTKKTDLLDTWTRTLIFFLQIQ